MHPRSWLVPLALLAFEAHAQQIYNFWTTTWDRSSLLTGVVKSTPITFTAPTVIGQADIQVNDDVVYQTVLGFGGTLTDSSALLFNNLKTKNSTAYWALLHYLFDPTNGANSAGLSYLRVPLGASDFSANVYSFHDSSGDTTLAKFNINVAPSYLFSVIKDIASINSVLRIHVLPWSPPAWMKDSNTMKGGSFLSSYVNTYAQYLLKSLQGLKGMGISVYALSIQNEPENSDSTYPSCLISASLEGQIGQVLRPLMDANGFAGTKLIAYDHNWIDASAYPSQVMDSYGAYFAGAAFHCYQGTVDQQDAFHSAYPDKEIYFTECAGTLGSDWWSDIKWYMDNLFIGSIQHSAMTGLMWGIAADGNGNPKLPGSDSCGGGCRGIVTINSDGTWSVNQEFYAMGQASKAITPRDVGGPWGQRIGVSVGGEMNWALVVGAYVTGRTHPSDWPRYSLVVLNWNDQANGGWDPVPVQTTIEFREMQATYTFPVGVTTLWWYAPNATSAGTFGEAEMAHEEYYGGRPEQQVLGRFDARRVKA